MTSTEYRESLNICKARGIQRCLNLQCSLTQAAERNDEDILVFISCHRKEKEMDRYFYSVEEIDGSKTIHMSGNVYCNDESSANEKDYRIAEWVWVYINIDTLTKKKNENKLWDFLDENVRYLEDISKEDADRICNEYFDGSPGSNLDIRKVDANTICGDYWFDR